ncbi:MAG TPA: segregation/condensation protein A, partial [Desulfomonilia bacterium]|nr:segregation/condensation protein A [Desulfomonilia bacterium]
LDLLLYLIEKNRFTLHDLEVTPIIDQYLAYIEQVRSLDISLAGEFLDMASYLIWLKSRLLLPDESARTDEEGKNPVEELKEMLLAYQAIKAASRELGMKSMLYWDIFPKGASAEERDVFRTSLGPLMEAIQAINARTRKLVMDVIPMRFSIQEIMARIQTLFTGKKKIALSEAAPSGEKMEIIGAFMAALEMSKLSIITLFQKGLFSTIYLVKRAGKH